MVSVFNDFPPSSSFHCVLKFFFFFFFIRGCRPLLADTSSGSCGDQGPSEVRVTLCKFQFHAAKLKPVTSRRRQQLLITSKPKGKLAHLDSLSLAMILIHCLLRELSLPLIIKIKLALCLLIYII